MKYISVQHAIAIGNSHPLNTLYQGAKNGRQSADIYASRVKRDDPEDAKICLTCTKKRCTGGRECFESRRRKLQREGGA